MQNQIFSYTEDWKGFYERSNNRKPLSGPLAQSFLMKISALIGLVVNIKEGVYT